MSSFSLLQNSLNRKNNKQTIELLKLGIKSEMNKLNEDQIKSIVSGGDISKLLRKNNTYSDQEMSKLWSKYLQIVKSTRTLTKEENKQCENLQEEIDRLRYQLSSKHPSDVPIPEGDIKHEDSHFFKLKPFQQIEFYIYIQSKFDNFSLGYNKYINITGNETKNFHVMFKEHPKYLDYVNIYISILILYQTLKKPKKKQDDFVKQIFEHVLIEYIISKDPSVKISYSYTKDELNNLFIKLFPIK